MKFEALKGKRVLVTGGAGFIGSHLVGALLKLGANVKVIDNFSTGKKENIRRYIKDIELIEGDIRDKELCKKVIKGIEIVSHQAALGSVPRSLKEPSTTISVNIAGSANIFESCRDENVEKVVFASSSSVYGDSQQLPKKVGEEGKPLSPYALSKMVDEQLAEVFARCYGMKIIGLRYFNVYGPRQDPEGPYAAVIPKFFKAFQNNEDPVIYGDGEQTRDFTFVDDVVRANLLAFLANDSAFNRCYNISGGKSISINELAKQIGMICGKREIKPIYMPKRIGDIMHSQADLTDSQLLGYYPTTGLKEGLSITFESFQRAKIKGDLNE